jgi:hypothetical protein
VIMREYGIDSALTSDEDSEQAGFKRLMDPRPLGVREPAAPYGARMDQMVEKNAMREMHCVIASAVGSNDEFLNCEDQSLMSLARSLTGARWVALRHSFSQKRSVYPHAQFAVG